MFAVSFVLGGILVSVLFLLDVKWGRLFWCVPCNQILCFVFHLNAVHKNANKVQIIRWSRDTELCVIVVAMEADAWFVVDI